MAMYDDSPAKDVLQSIREKSNGSPINTWDIKNKIIEGAEIEGYEHFLCPSETKIKALNWLAEPKQTLNSISPALTGFTSHYGTNLGIVGRKNHADDLKQAKWDQESRSAQGRLQKIKSPSKSMFLGEMNMAEKISGWATFHAFDFNIPKYPIGMSLTDFLKTGQKYRFDMFRHGPLQTNILFVDGHASQVHFEDFSKVWMNKGIDR
jgi:prepilin-type processing-associated H-X9-DG protein